MKTQPTRAQQLVDYYQQWLTGMTKLSIALGPCHPLIHNSHRLMLAHLHFPDAASQPAVVPQCLYRVVYGSLPPEPLTNEQDMGINFKVDIPLLRYRPILEGVLLNECMRLDQVTLANKLTSLFQQCKESELRHKLVWLCWYDLLIGAPLTDWQDNLKFKKPQQLREWIIQRQTENWPLTSIMDEYLMFEGCGSNGEG